MKRLQDSTSSSASDSGLRDALDLIWTLAVEIGPRRPCSEAERRAADELMRWLRDRSISADLQAFRGFPSGGYSYGVIFGTALAGGLLQRRRPILGSSLASVALAAAALEGDLRVTPVTDLLSRWKSANLTATIPAAEELRQRVVIVGHMDSTRSGLVFHPNVIGQLPRLVRIPAVSTLLLVLWPLLRHLPGGGRMRRAALAGLLVTVGLLVERELRGEDVPGANDNASGTAVAMQLAAELAAQPLRHTQVDLLITGCEESWGLGAIAYLDRLERELAEPDAIRPIFVNFDTVGGPGVPLTYIQTEGTTRPLRASTRLCAMLERLGRERPELTLESAGATAGLPTDVTAALARGFEAVTLLAQSEQGIPNYHWPSDTFENVDPDTVWRTLEAGRALLAELDREVALRTSD